MSDDKKEKMMTPQGDTFDHDRWETKGKQPEAAPKQPQEPFRGCIAFATTLPKPKTNGREPERKYGPKLPRRAMSGL
ncbi:MAG: hypothetical protein V1492_01050 [Candidatus Micrarchaeota archaeon]